MPALIVGAVAMVGALGVVISAIAHGAWGMALPFCAPAFFGEWQVRFIVLWNWSVQRSLRMSREEAAQMLHELETAFTSEDGG